MRFLFLALLGFVVTGCSTGNKALDLSHDGAVQDGQIVRDYTVSKVALDKLKERYESDPDNTKALRSYAGGLYQAQDYEEVIKILTPFVEQDTAEAKDYYFYAKALHANKHDNLAKTWLKKTLDQAPDMIVARLMLADIYEVEGELKAAELLYLDALNTDAGNGLDKADHIQLTLGYILNLVSQSRTPEASDAVITLKQEHPDNVLVERNMRIVLAMMQSYGHSIPKPLARPNEKL